MFRDKQFIPKKLDGRNLLPAFWGQKNSWYQLDEAELQTLCVTGSGNQLTLSPFDVVVVDGPNGNGRSLAFLAMKHCVQPGTLIFVDDYDHYDFEERLRGIYDITRIHAEKTTVQCSDGTSTGECSGGTGDGTVAEAGRFAVYEVQ
jgi:hypothetical protein